MNKVHFIAVGGAAMHNLALALHGKGIQVSGSDDEIFEPSRTRLAAKGLLPEKMGWNPERITSKLDAVILGMHARADNPELLAAQKMGVPIYSYPEFLYQQTQNKKRVVIAGSHGKTTITAMVIHVLRYHGIKFDYMVGSKIDGFENMVGLSGDSEFAVFEGDEYLSSPLDLRPKFMHYHPHVALISGIAWDHINVFPTFELYVQQFAHLINALPDEGKLVYYQGDAHLRSLALNCPAGVEALPYQEHDSIREEGRLALITREGKRVPLQLFGKHNLQNLNGARLVCAEMGISPDDFYEAIGSFTGTAKRLQLLHAADSFSCYLDFAHSPSKVKATIEAVKEQFPDRELVAVFELHTFSSLNKEFIPQYRDCFDKADTPVVYFDSAVLEHKKMEPLLPEFVQEQIGNPNLRVFSKPEDLEKFVQHINKQQVSLLLMSSGNFSGLPLAQWFR